MDKHHYNVSLKWKEGRIDSLEVDGLKDKITVGYSTRI